MSYPSVKTIQDRLLLDKCKAKLVRSIMDQTMRSSAILETFPAVHEWYRQCYYRPRRIEVEMKALDAALEGHGTEAVWGDSSITWPVAEYVNMGDPYVQTIWFYYPDSKYIVSDCEYMLDYLRRKGHNIV